MMAEMKNCGRSVMEKYHSRTTFGIVAENSVLGVVCVHTLLDALPAGHGVLFDTR
jgi:hypothetical protein